MPLDSGGPPPPGERQREGIKNLGLHNELGLSDSRAVMGRAYLKAMGLVISHASHTFGGRRIEDPWGGSPPPPHIWQPQPDAAGYGSLAIRGRRVVTRSLGTTLANSQLFLTFRLDQHGRDHWREYRRNVFEATCRKTSESLEKSPPDRPKSSPGASKIEPGALQDAIFKRPLT